MSEEESMIVGAMISIVCVILMVISFAVEDPAIRVGIIVGQVMLVMMGVVLFIASLEGL